MSAIAAPPDYDLYARTDLGGNTAKTRTLDQLAARISRTGGLRILDVGCAGPRPLEFWAPLLDHPGFDFHLTGIDVAGISRARAVARDRGWAHRVRLIKGSAYQLSTLLGPGAFDIAVATQVLEHVACLETFIGEVAECLAPDGECFFTADSAEFAAPVAPSLLIRAGKNLVKAVMARVGNETHYDLPWKDQQIAAACKNNGLDILETRYYNLPTLKRIHNGISEQGPRNGIMRLWLALEDAINDDEELRERTRADFLDLYVRARKR